MRDVWCMVCIAMNPTPYLLRLHAAAVTAELQGFPHLAAALRAMILLERTKS